MCWIWAILAVPFTSNVDGIALGTGPLFSIKLCIRFVDFLIVDDHNMVSDTMRLIGRFRPVFNICVGHT